MPNSPDYVPCPTGMRSEWRPAQPEDHGRASDKVDERFAAASRVSDRAWRETLEMLNRLRYFAADIEEKISHVDLKLPKAPTIGKVQNPIYENVRVLPFFRGQQPNEFRFDLPEFRPMPSKPDIRIGATPDKPNITAPGSFDIDPYTPRDIETPEKVRATIPPDPEIDLSGIVIPPPPSINVPEWEGPLIPPSEGLDLPANQFHYDDIGDYTGSLLLALSDKLESIIIDGGTGLHPDVEQALYDRAFIRLDTEKSRRQQEAYNAIAGRGFSLPTGVLSAALIEVDKEFSRQLREVNMDILVKQAELAQQNTHHAQQLAQQVEAVMVSAHQEKARRLMEIAVKEYEFFLAYYMQRVQIYNARIEAYKSYSQAYESRVRAELAHIEIWKGQLEGARLSTELQKMSVDIYTALVQAQSLKVELYKAELQASVTEMEVERMKLEVFESQVKAYLARVQAYTARMGAYQTEVSAHAETVKAEALKIQAYDTEVKAESTVRDSEIRAKEMELLKYENEMKQYAMELQYYQVQYQVQIAEMDALLRKNGFELDVYKANTENELRQFEGEIKHHETRIQAESSKAALELKKQEINVENQKYLLTMDIERLKHISSVLSQVTASALGAVNASATVGFSSGWSTGVSNNFGMNYSKACNASNSYSRTESLSG